MNMLSIWGKGQLMAFSGLEGTTDFADGIVLRTCDDAAIDIKAPEAGGRIVFPGGMTTDCFLSSDCVRIGETYGVLTDAHHVLFQGNVIFEGLSGKYTVSRRNDMTLLGVTSHFKESWLDMDIQTLFKRRLAFFDTLPTFGETDETTLAALMKAYSQMKGQIYSPCSDIPHFWSTPDRWPHKKMWLWDSVFHAIGVRHVNTALAKDLLWSVVDKQHADGLIPHMMSPVGDSSITQGPVMALGLKQVLDCAPDDGFLKMVFPKLERYLEWNMANRDTDGGGLLEWNIEGEPTCRSGESGMDNSPRFDSATQLDATDFNAFMSNECEIMAGFAERLHDDEKRAYWQAHHERLNRLINEKLWCEEAGLYQDRDTTTDKLTGISASSGFMPLLCGAPSAEQAAKMVAKLRDPQAFATPFRVPSISRECEAYYSKDMWRGPVWININWLIAKGLERYGYRDDAKQIYRETMEMERHYYLKYGTFFEFFDDRNEVEPPQLLRKGSNDPNGGYHQVFFDYGWSATLFIDLVKTLAEWK